MKTLVLSAEEKAKLELMARRPKTDQRPAQRARIVLDCATGLSNTAVAAKRGGTLPTVASTWRARLATFSGLSIIIERMSSTPTWTDLSAGRFLQELDACHLPVLK